MNDADIERLWSERWDQIDPSELVDFMCNHVVAMADPQTITRAADDVDHIAKRVKELAEERAEARRQNDPETATIDNLDRVASDWGEKRNGETDYAFRARLLKKIRGE
jgi:hypothetical protein